MSLTVENIVEWKQDKNQFGIDSYTWFFNELINNYISKMNGAQRNAQMISMHDFTTEAVDYVIYQLLVINSDAANELIAELKLNEVYISDHDKKYIEPKSKFD